MNPHLLMMKLSYWAWAPCASPCFMISCGVNHPSTKSPHVFCTFVICTFLPTLGYSHTLSPTTIRSLEPILKITAKTPSSLFHCLRLCLTSHPGVSASPYQTYRGQKVYVGPSEQWTLFSKAIIQLNNVFISALRIVFNSSLQHALGL